MHGSGGLPRCARLVLTGDIQKVPKSAVSDVSKAMFALHPEMKSWPSDHGFYFVTLNITNIWLIDMFGGASNIAPKDYYAVTGIKPDIPKLLEQFCYASSV